MIIGQRYERNQEFGSVSGISDALLRRRPPVAGSECHILSSLLNYGERYWNFSYHTWCYTPASVIKYVGYDVLKPWLGDTTGYEFYSQSSAIVRVLEDTYELDVPLICWLFYNVIETKCTSEVKRERARDTLRRFFLSSRNDMLQLVDDIERNVQVDVQLSTSTTFIDYNLENGEGAQRLRFPPWTRKRIPYEDTSKIGGEPRVKSATEEQSEDEDEATTKKVETTPRSSVATSDDPARTTSDDELSRVAEWGILLRLGIGYVGRGPSGIVDDKTLRATKANWDKSTQKGSLEDYLAKEKGLYEKLCVLYGWVNLEPPNDYQRTIRLIKNLNNNLGKEFEKYIRRRGTRPESLTYKSTVSTLTTLDANLSIQYPWDDKIPPDTKHQKVPTKEKPNTDGSSGKGEKTPPRSHAGGAQRQKKWCDWCKKEVYHSPDKCWNKPNTKTSTPSTPNPLKSTEKKPPSPSVPSTPKPPTAKGNHLDASPSPPSSSNTSWHTPSPRYPLRGTAQRQPGFSYSYSVTDDEKTKKDQDCCDHAVLGTGSPALMARSYDEPTSTNGKVKGIICEVAGVTCVAAIDTMCERSCIDSGFVDGNGFTVGDVTKPVKVTDFGGRNHVLDKAINEVVVVGNMRLNCTIYTTELTGGDFTLLLGTDILTKLKPVISWYDDKLYLPDNTVVAMTYLPNLSGMLTTTAKAFSTMHSVPMDRLDDYLGGLSDEQLDEYLEFRLCNFVPPELAFSITDDDLPFQVRRSYTVPSHLQNGLMKTLAEAERLGQIRKVTYDDSYFISPAFARGKSRLDSDGDEEARLLCDLRSLNGRVKIPFADFAAECPSAEVFLGDVGMNDVYYSVIDLTNAFHTTRVSPEARKSLVFRVGLGDGNQLYQYCCCPQGFALSAQFFCLHIARILSREFGSAWRLWATLWIDDVLVHGHTLPSVAKRDRLLRRGLVKAKKGISSKSQQPAQEVSCIGLWFEKGFYRLDESSLKRLLNILSSVPHSVKEVRRLIGVILYAATAFSWDAFSYSTLTRLLQPLHRVVNDTVVKKNRFAWNKDAAEALSELRQHVANTPLRQFSLTDALSKDSVWCITLDASEIGCGSCLFQVWGVPPSQITASVLQDPTHSALVSLQAKTFNSSERRFFTYEKESLSLVLSLKKWGSLIVSSSRYKEPNAINCVVLSDNVATISHFSDFKVTGDPGVSARVRRYLGWLDDIAFARTAGVSIRHLSGELNAISDVLSRYYSEINATSNATIPTTPFAYSLLNQEDPLQRDGEAQCEEGGTINCTGIPPDPTLNGFKIIHPDWDFETVVYAASLLRSDTTKYLGVRIKDIVAVASSQGATDVAPIVSVQIRAWLGDSMWLLEHPAIAAANDDNNKKDNYLLLYVLSPIKSSDIVPVKGRFRTRLVVPYIPVEPDNTGSPTLRSNLLSVAHSRLHLGVGSTQDTATRLGWWPSILLDSRMFVSRCLCQENKAVEPSNRNFGDNTYDMPRFSVISMDHKAIPDSLRQYTTFTTVLSISDLASGYCIYEPQRGYTAQETYVTVFRRWLCRFSIPSTVITDMSPSFINTVFAACNRLLGITHHRKVGTRNARGNAHIERRNAFLGHAFKLATERGTVRCDEDLVNTLGFAEILANQLIRQGDNNGSTCAFERVYGESPRLPSVLTDSPITDDERSLESSDQDGRSLYERIRATALAVGDEYRLWRESQALDQQRRQRARLAHKRRLHSTDSFAIGDEVNFEGQIHTITEVLRDDTGHIITLKLSDGTVVPVGNVRPAAMNNIVEDVPLHATTAGHLGFKENDCVFYRVKNADYDSDSGKPEWYIYVGKIVQVDEANAEYKIHVYSGERRWLPLWERYRRGGGYEFVRRRHCPDNGVPRIISVKIADVVAPCGLTRGGALDEQSKNWLHSTGVAAPD